jgi:hypothetical protein
MLPITGFLVKHGLEEDFRAELPDADGSMDVIMGGGQYSLGVATELGSRASENCSRQMRTTSFYTKLSPEREYSLTATSELHLPTHGWR